MGKDKPYIRDSSEISFLIIYPAGIPIPRRELQMENSFDVALGFV